MVDANVENLCQSDLAKLPLSSGDVKDPRKLYEGAWLGANDIETEGKFVWEATGQSITYSNWSLGQPDNWKEEDCVHLMTGSEGKWNDLKCDSPKQITMCERVIHPGKDTASRLIP